MNPRCPERWGSIRCDRFVGHHGDCNYVDGPPKSFVPTTKTPGEGFELNTLREQLKSCSCPPGLGWHIPSCYLYDPPTPGGSKP